MRQTTTVLIVCRGHRPPVEMAANPATKQAKQTASHQASNAEQAPCGHRRPPAEKAANSNSSKQCKAADHQVGTAAHQPKGRLIPAPGGKHGKRTLGGRFPLPNSRGLSRQASKANPPPPGKRAEQALGTRRSPAELAAHPGHQAGTSVHELKWQQTPTPKRRTNQTASQQARTAEKAPCGHRRPPIEKAANSNTEHALGSRQTIRWAPPPTSRKGGKLGGQELKSPPLNKGFNLKPNEK